MVTDFSIQTLIFHTENLRNSHLPQITRYKFTLSINSIINITRVWCQFPQHITKFNFLRMLSTSFINQATKKPQLYAFWAYLSNKSAKIHFYLYNYHHFQRSRSFEVKFPDKVPLTPRWPSNIPTKFYWYKQNTIGENAKLWFSKFLL